MGDDIIKVSFDVIEFKIGFENVWDVEFRNTGEVVTLEKLEQPDSRQLLQSHRPGPEAAHPVNQQFGELVLLQLFHLLPRVFVVLVALPKVESKLVQNIHHPDVCLQ